MSDPTPVTPAPIDKQTTFYPVGARIVLPSGAVYEQTPHGWKRVAGPPSPPMPAARANA